MKKFLSVLLAILLVLVIVPQGAIPANAAMAISESEGGFASIEASKPEAEETEPVTLSATSEGYITGRTITRAEWLHNLVILFGIDIAEEEYPDNYYSDVTEDTAYYGDIMKAAKYGLIDIEAGDPLEPEISLERDFAVHTLNFGLGIQLEEGASYTFSDTVAHADDAQAILNEGWLSLSGGKFEPEQVVTAGELSNMLDGAAAILEERNSTVSKSNYTFASYVKQIPETAAVEYGDGSVAITGYTGTINDGDTFAVFNQGLAYVYQAVSVIGEDDTLYITTTDAPDDAVISAEFSGEITPESLEYVPSEAQRFKLRDGRSVTFGASRAITHGKDWVKFSKSINFSDSVSGSLTGMIKNIRVKASILGSVKYATVSGDVEITSSISFSGLDSAANHLALGGISLAPLGYIGLELQLNMEATISYTYNTNFVFGVEYRNGSFCTISNIAVPNTCFSAEGKASAILAVTAWVDFGPIGRLDANAGIGPKISIGMRQYPNGKPTRCVTISGYLYAGITLSARFIGVGSWRKNYEYYGPHNSPIRFYEHMEDGVTVYSCKRGIGGVDGAGFYVTPSNSRYYCSGNRNFYSEFVPVILWETSDNDDGTVTITKYSGNVSVLNVPETIDGKTVTKIGSKAFEGNSILRTVIFPQSVTTIGSSAFSGCTNLITARFSECLTAIEGHAFYGCSSLKEVILPEGLTSLGEASGFGSAGESFANCAALEKVYIPSTLKTVSTVYGGNFEGCTSLTHIEFGEGIVAIPSGLFLKCPAITTLEIPETVTTIGSSAFSGCTNLTTVHFNEYLTKIEGHAFYGCSLLREAILPEGLTSLGEASGFGGAGECFANCTALEKVYIPSTLKTVSTVYGGNFEGCTSLTSIEFGEGITTIPGGLFLSCPAITTLEIPETVTKIGASAFSGCANLITVHFNEYMTEIEGHAFYGCSLLREAILPEGLTSLGEASGFGGAGECFANCTALEKVYIPSTLKTVSTVYGGNFEGCTSLTNIEFGEGITAIPARLFLDCQGFKTIDLPTTVNEVGTEAFSGCTGLQEITIPNSVTEYGNGLFSNCSALKKVSLPVSFTVIKSSMFKNCTALIDCTFLKEVVTSISENAFSGCSGLKEAILPDAVRTLGNNAFQDCTNLVKLNASFDLDGIGNNCFRNCTTLTDITLNDGLRTIGNYAFQGCMKLEKITLPNTVTNLGSYAFQQCSKLNSVDISTGITELKEYTFANCLSLTGIVIPKGVQTIDSYAFYQDTKLTEMTLPVTLTSISDNNAISYPTKMTIKGCAGTYAEGWATSKRCKAFVDITKHATDFELASGEDTIIVPRYETVRPQFLLTPAESTDAVMLSSSDSCVRVDNNTKLYGNSIDTATVTAATSGGLTKTYRVEVKRTSSISVTKEPDKLIYGTGEKINLTGLIVTANFSDGTTSEVTGHDVSGFSTQTLGKREVTIAWGGRTASFEIEVVKTIAGTLGKNNELSWSYNSKTEEVSISGALPAGEVVYAASYNKNGKMLSASTMIRSDDSAKVPETATVLKLIWLNTAKNPQCVNVAVDLTA